MREIIFRGKRVDNGEWVEGFYIEANHHWHNKGIHKEWIVTNTFQNGGWCNVASKYAVIPETVGQYTGYTDDYAKKIFEGDILRVLSTNCYGNDLCYTLTLYDMTDTVEMERINTANEVKVIGNIHDNPELLDGVQ